MTDWLIDRWIDLTDWLIDGLIDCNDGWGEQSSALTGLGVGVAVSLGAAVGRRLLVELVLGEAQGQRVGRAGPARGLVVSEPAVTAALLGAIGQVEGDTALGLQGRNRTTSVSTTVIAQRGQFRRCVVLVICRGCVTRSCAQFQAFMSCFQTRCTWQRCLLLGFKNVSPDAKWKTPQTKEILSDFTSLWIPFECWLGDFNHFLRLNLFHCWVF